MNSRRFAGIFLLSSTVAKAVVTRGSGGAVRLVGDDEIEGRHPAELERLGDLRRRLVGGEHHARSRAAQEVGDPSGSVVTRSPSSLALITIESLATVSSEHTGRYSKAVVVLAVHSISVWLSSDSDGASTSVRSAPSFSLTNSDVSVLPVPHAMIIWPRSDFEPVHHRVDGLDLVVARLFGRQWRGQKIRQRVGPVDLCGLQFGEAEER